MAQELIKHFIKHAFALIGIPIHRNQQKSWCGLSATAHNSNFVIIRIVGMVGGCLVQAPLIR